MVSVADALEGAGKVLFYISRAALDSDNCRREIHFALDKGFEIVPVYLADVELPGDLQIGLNLVQALHRHRDASYRQHLLGALDQPDAPLNFDSLPCSKGWTSPPSRARLSVPGPSLLK